MASVFDTDAVAFEDFEIRSDTLAHELDLIFDAAVLSSSLDEHLGDVMLLQLFQPDGRGVAGKRGDFETVGEDLKLVVEADFVLRHHSGDGGVRSVDVL